MSLDDSAARLDASDKLAPFRSRFALPSGTIYLDGNSLGPISVEAEAALQSALESWKTHRIEGWTEGSDPWLFLPESLGARLAPLVGVAPDEVVATGSTTVNLHQLLATLYDGRGKVLLDAGSFSDGSIRAPEPPNASGSRSRSLARLLLARRRRAR